MNKDELDVIQHFQNKTICICGATGFIGLNLVKTLLTTNVEKIICTFHTDRDFFYGNLFNDSKIVLRQVDLTDKNDCLMVTKNVDYLVMCNAVSFGAAYIDKNPFDLVNSNTIMNVLLLEAAAKNGVKKVVYYASTTGYPDTENEVSECDMFIGDPFNKYFGVGWMKRYTEKLLEWYSSKLNLFSGFSLRLSNIYGPMDKFNFNGCHVLPAMVRKFVERQNPLEIWGDGTESRDLIYIDDVVNITLLSLLNLEGFHAFNIGLGQNFTVNDIIDLLSKQENFYPERKYILEKPRMIKKRAINVEKMKNLLNYIPKTDIIEGLKLTTEWYKKNQGLIYR